MQVCAAGALLSILHREGLLRSSQSASLAAAPDQDDACLADSALRRRKEADMHFCVESLSELHLLGHLYVDSASMHALQVFQVRLLSKLLTPGTRRRPAHASSYSSHKMWESAAFPGHKDTSPVMTYGQGLDLAFLREHCGLC